jgi:hypothetical protein
MAEVLLHAQLAVVGFQVRDPKHMQLLWSAAAPLEKTKISQVRQRVVVPLMTGIAF